MKSQERIAGEKKAPLVQDLHNHSPAQLAELGLLLSSGAPLRPDPRRRDFFEIDGHSRVFYIWKYPTATKVFLIGVWKRDQSSEDAGLRTLGFVANGSIIGGAQEADGPGSCARVANDV